MTQQTIKQVALPLFAEQGYEGTSLSEIASGVGIKKPSIYAHFKGKEELFLAVFEEVLQHQVRYVEERRKKQLQDTLDSQIYQFLTSTCDYYRENEVEAAFLKRAMLFPPPFLKEALSQRFLEQEKHLLAILRALFEKGVGEGVLRPNRIEDLIAAFLALMDGLFVQLYYYSPENHEERIRGAWNIFWTGIRSETQK